MECKSNQIIIQKVENGFILTLQEKSNSNVFKVSQMDKKHFVAENEKSLIELLKNKIPSMVKDISNGDNDE